MTALRWITAQDLGILADGSYFEKQITAICVDDTVFYRIIGGSLPTGIQLTSNGLLLGNPNISNEIEQNSLVNFTIRAQTPQGVIADRTFKVLISGVQPPTIISTVSNLGQYYDGNYFKYQLESSSDTNLSNLSWRFVRGRLPPGITLSTQGLLEGFFYQNKIDPSGFNKIGWDRTGWDDFMFDFVANQNDNDYEFTLELSDGINYSRQTYVIRVIAKDLLTGDGNFILLNNPATVDTTPRHLPFISTMPQILSQIKPNLARENTYFAFKFDAVDFDGSEISYEISSPDQRGFDQDGDNIDHTYGTGYDMIEYDSSEYTMPLYVGLNNDTGWYTGHLASQVEHQQDFTIQIYARKKSDLTLRGHRNTFQVRVLGQSDESTNWVTDSDLGSIENGTLSLLQVSAVNNKGKIVEYQLKSASSSRTPQGLVLQRNGLISGRASFEFFSIDSEKTTVDNGRTTFEERYTFTVIAQTRNRTSYNERTFTLKVSHINKVPFENLYLKGFPSVEQRELFRSIINHPDLFPDQLIYRPNDPYYGKSQDLQFLFLPGVNPSLLATYVEALNQNHYNKTILFGDVKTAVSLDENYNVVYEVVYLDVIDQEEGQDPVTKAPKAPAQTIDLSRLKNKPMVNGMEVSTLTPNALGNMVARIQDAVGIANSNTLPTWMICPQIDSSNPGHFVDPLGYTKAVVLAYTIPGASKLIAYRLKNANFTFNHIPFVSDRYQLDNYLTNNFDVSSGKYILGNECTIDQVSSVYERYRLKGSVDYAVTVPFEKIHGQRVEYIQHWGCLDGEINFTNGETIIFAQQENFQSDPLPFYYHYDVFGNRIGPNQIIKKRATSNLIAGFAAVPLDYTNPMYEQQWINNDGLNITFDRWIYWIDGWIINLPFSSDPFGSVPFAKTTKILGYIDQIIFGFQNARAGVYQLSVDDENIAHLTLIQNTTAGDIVRINKGATYIGKQMYFEAYPKRGNVPRWWVFDQPLLIDYTSSDNLVRPHKETTFDQRGTRFFSNRDQYLGPGIEDKYIKFPKQGVFI